MNDNLNLKIKVLAVMLVSIIFTLICASVLLGVRDKKIYPSNLLVNGTSLANLPKAQVVEFLHKVYAEQKLILAMPNDFIELDLNECGIELNTEATLEKMEPVDAHLISNLVYRGSVKKVVPVFKWDEAQLNKVLEGIAAQNSKPAVNARIIKKDDLTWITPQEKGYQISKDELLKAVTESLADGDLGPVKVPYEDLNPKITLSDLQKIKSLIAVTNYKNVVLNETDRQIISELDNTVILSGDTLNLDELWATQGIDIKSSRIIKVLKSLFNNISYQIDLDFDEATNTIHNRLTNPILLNIYIDQDILWLSIIGNNDDVPRKISLLVEETSIPAPITKKIDNSLPAGEQRIVKGKDTVVIKKYRVVEEAGKIIEKVLLAEEKYLGYATIIYTGPGTINK